VGPGLSPLWNFSFPLDFFLLTASSFPACDPMGSLPFRYYPLSFSLSFALVPLVFFATPCEFRSAVNTLPIFHFRLWPSTLLSFFLRKQSFRRAPSPNTSDLHAYLDTHPTPFLLFFFFLWSNSYKFLSLLLHVNYVIYLFWCLPFLIWASLFNCSLSRRGFLSFSSELALRTHFPALPEDLFPSPPFVAPPLFVPLFFR